MFGLVKGGIYTSEQYGTVANLSGAARCTFYKNVKTAVGRQYCENGW